MALAVVGSTTIHNPAASATPITSVAVPTGTQAGDLLILSIEAFYSTLAVTDTRMDEVVRVTAPFSSSLDINGGVWVGTADGSGDPIDVNIAWTAENYVSVALAVIRGARILSTATYPNPTAPAAIPGGTSPAVIAAQFSGYSVVDGQFVTPDGWFDAGRTAAGKSNAGIIWTRPYPSGSTVWGPTAGGYQADWSGMVVLSVSETLVAPPARLFPRSDDLGVGSGRHFPPPKSQQRSNRRFGYY